MTTDYARTSEPRKPEPQAGVVDPAKVEPDAQEMTRIVLRPIGSPLPLGFFTVAIDNVLVSTLQWGMVPGTDRRAVALIVFPAFIVQAIAGLFALSARDSIAGTLMLSFATTWLIDALVFFVDPPGAAAALGVFYVVFAVFISFMLASALLKRAIVAVLAVAAPRFLISGVARNHRQPAAREGRRRAGLPPRRSGAVHSVRAADGGLPRSRGAADRAIRRGPAGHPRHPGRRASRHRAAARRPPHAMKTCPMPS